MQPILYVGTSILAVAVAMLWLMARSQERRKRQYENEMDRLRNNGI